MNVSRRNWLGRTVGLAAAVLLAAGLVQSPARAQGGDLVVFAAASLKNALDAVNAQWQKETGKKVTISYAASSALAKQIEQGAPADVFLSADTKNPQALIDKGLADGSAVTFATNTLTILAVVIAWPA